jgi:hypothetical protein
MIIQFILYTVTTIVYCIFALNMIVFETDSYNLLMYYHIFYQYHCNDTFICRILNWKLRRVLVDDIGNDRFGNNVLRKVDEGHRQYHVEKIGRDPIKCIKNFG